jgi:hypothetical protein
MPGKRGLPQCKATTMRGEQCRARAVKDGLCQCHHSDMASAWKERNRVALRAYWAARRIAEEFVAASGGASRDISVT